MDNKSKPATAMVAPSSAAVNGKIYAISKVAPSGGSVNYEYNPDTNTWTTKSTPPLSDRYGMGSAVYNNKIYLFGGVEHGGPLATVAIYDSATDSWSTGASMPTASTGPTASVVNDKIYILGGTSPSFGDTGGSNIVQIYNPTTNSWTTGANMPTKRQQVVAAVVNNKIYAIGGTSGGITYYTLVEEYDPATNTWTTKAPISTTTFVPNMAASVNNKIYVIGIDIAAIDFNPSVYVYDPATNTWGTETNIPTPRGGFGDSSDAVLDGTIYVIGGENNGYKATVEAMTVTVTSNPLISLSPTSLSFSATRGGSNPASQTVSITNTGGGTLSWTASTTATWLSLSPTSGTAPSTITVSANISGMSSGTYNATITITATGATNTPQTISVTLTITEPSPTISLSATSLSFSATQGGSNPTPQTVNITNTGGGTLNWTASATATWLSMSPTSGTALSSISVSANISGMSRGTYNATITITATGATNTPQTIPVTLTITEPSPNISLSPTSLSFSATQGGSNPANQTVSVTNTGGGTLNWTASTTATWLSLSPTSGTATPTSPASITVSANIATMSAGTYNAAITITATGATNTPQTIPVTLTITEPSPIISLSAASLSFSAIQGGSNPASQTVNITNTGGGTLNWTASATATWLSISPTSGTAPSSITVSANISGMSAGTYNATITISATGATNKLQIISVTLTISPPPVTTSTTSTTSSTTTSISTTTTTAILTTTTVPQTTTTTPTISTTTTTIPRIAAFIQPTAINVGEKARITASSTDPADTLSFTSSNPGVATVDQQGVVTGIAPGTVAITITGSRSGATSTVTVTVSKPTVIAPPLPVVGIAPNIVQVGFQFTRLTLSAISGWTITLGATVVGGEGDVRVEVFYTTTGVFGEPITQSIGILKDPEKDGLYEMEISGIPPGAVPVGEIPLSGFSIEARDSKGRIDKWPVIMIGGEGTGAVTELIRVPVIDLRNVNSPVPIIFQAGYGLSHLLIIPQQGGTFTLQATAFGGVGSLRVQAFFETVDVFGKKVTQTLGTLQDQDGDGVYKLEIPVPPGVVSAGEIPIPGLRVTATDSLGQTDAWPNLVVWR